MKNFDKVFIIAEAGVNHNGDIEKAFKMVDAAKDAGADAVKFQNFKTELLAKRDLPKETYQKDAAGDNESQFEMLKKLELSAEATKRIMDYAGKVGIEFISTPYDRESADLLEKLGVNIIKIGSGEITDLPFLQYVAKKQIPIILSTGAATMREVEDAVEVITKEHRDIVLLHCTSSYPTRLEDVHLNAMKTLMETFDFPVGYSDHTVGVIVSPAAAALGAKVIEKHFTLDKTLPGPDHKASVDPGELKELVRNIRDIEIAMGDYEKKPCDSEKETILMGRRSILTKKAVKKDSIITEDMLVTRRPATGIAPGKLHLVVGKRAKRDIDEDYIISFDDIY